MKLFKYLIGIMAVATLTSCDILGDDKPKEYVTLDSITNTLWYSANVEKQIYYDIYYYESTGVMIAYKSSLRDEELERRTFTYTFTPPTIESDAIVELKFDDGESYGGILIPKGHFQINDDDVFLIQLYGVDDKGEVIYDENQKIKSTILMWKE